MRSLRQALRISPSPPVPSSGACRGVAYGTRHASALLAVRVYRAGCSCGPGRRERDRHSAEHPTKQHHPHQALSSRSWSSHREATEANRHRSNRSARVSTKPRPHHCRQLAPTRYPSNLAKHSGADARLGHWPSGGGSEPIEQPHHLIPVFIP